MKLSRRKLTSALLSLSLSLSLCVWFVAVTATWAEELGYRQRGNRYEGIRGTPVSGFDIELISACVDYPENFATLGDWFRVRFFLDQPQPVYMVVRELDNQHYYWLDKVQPPFGGWQSGFKNEFVWPTADVIRRLEGLGLSDLGVVVRLGKENSSADERVAPAIFYQSRYPVVVSGYVFTFRLRNEAHLTARIYRADSRTPVMERNLGDQLGGRPLDVRWLTIVAAPGLYRMVLSGYELNSNDKISQTVTFYHQPMLQ